MGEEHRIDPVARPYDPAGLDPKPAVDAADFFAIDLRVGEVVEVEPFPEARKPSWKLTVDFGPVLGTLRTSAQVTSYAREDLLGRRVVGAVNLGVRRIAGFRSEFLVLGGLQPDGTVHLLGVDEALPLGAPVA